MDQITAAALQSEAYPLSLVINPVCDGALGLRNKAEVFYLNFPKLIKVNDLNGIHHEIKVDEKNIHLIDTDLQELVKIIRSERKRALRYYASYVAKFFFKENK